jgi:hypothetical protein
LIAYRRRSIAVRLAEDSAQRIIRHFCRYTPHIRPPAQISAVSKQGFDFDWTKTIAPLLEADYFREADTERSMAIARFHFSISLESDKMQGNCA